MVGALLCESEIESCVCGVIFFNNVGTLNMCIHGTIGLVATLVHLGRIGPGVHGIETPVGVVHAEVEGGGKVTIANVPSYRFRSAVSIDVVGWGAVVGDVAWGGNWFFLIDGQGPEVKAENLEELTAFCRAVKASLVEAGVCGADGGEIDHVEVFGPPWDEATSDGRNFVLCPGNAYDRSPCGTGTSAKLACLHADGKLMPGQVWRQAGVLGTIFEGRVEDSGDGKIIPRVCGHAWVTGESTYLFHDDDPFRYGIPSNP